MTMDHLNEEKEEVLTPETAQENEQTLVGESNQSDELTKAKSLLEEAKDKYLRLYAEFDNYRKRTMKESLEVRQTAAKDTIIALLPVLDDFERAKKIADGGQSGEVFSEGVNLVYQKLFSTLEARGVKAMDSNGEVFNAEFHEAITEIPAPTDDLKGKIIDTVEKGYFLHGKIIRYAKVVVGK